MNLNFLKGKIVLVTGGTGSFGQAFARKLLQDSRAKKIVVFSRDEFKQQELRRRLSDPKDRLRFFLGDVRDVMRLNRAFAGVDVVVHAAALKQVPALEYNPLEAVKTNVIGTQNVIDAALDNHVAKVLLLSTDKAVNPANLYGATKLCAEKLLVAANAYGRHAPSTIFSVVRYGNVVGSRGSVVDVLKEQTKEGTVTLTHRAMTRFWITLAQGAELVLHALSSMKGGEIFIPKLPAMKVTDLISALAPHCRVTVIGIRPGEKLHEALLTKDEVRRTKDAGRYYIIEPSHDWWNGRHLERYATLSEDFEYTSDRVEMLRREDFLNLI